MTGTTGYRTPAEIARFRDAHRHTRFVRRLRWLLPLLGAGVAVVFVVISVIQSFLLPGVTIGPVALKGSTLVMENPKLSGFDRNKRAYEFSAKRATQDVASPKKIQLAEISARVELAANGWTKINADRGFFDGDAETFLVESNIRATTSLGYELLLQDAFIDMKTGSMSSKKSVEVRQGDNNIVADTLSVTDGGGVIRFEGHVRATFSPETVGEN